MIVSMFTAVGMAIKLLVEALMPVGVGATASEGGEPPEGEKGLKE